MQGLWLKLSGASRETELVWILNLSFSNSWEEHINQDLVDNCLPLSCSDLMPPKAELSLIALWLGDIGKGKFAKCNTVILLLCSCCHALETAQRGNKKLYYTQKWVGLVQMLPWGFISQAGLAFHTLARYLLNSFPLHCDCEVNSWSGWYIKWVVWFFSRGGGCAAHACATTHPFCFSSAASQSGSEWMSLSHRLSETSMWAINLIIAWLDW